MVNKTHSDDYFEPSSLRLSFLTIDGKDASFAVPSLYCKAVPFVADSFYQMSKEISACFQV